MNRISSRRQSPRADMLIGAMRCFLAMELSEAPRAHLASVQAKMRPLVPGASYPRAQNLHMTLKFLGDADDRQIATLYESLRHVKVNGRLELAASGITGFPQRGLARVLVASMAGSETILAALHDALEQRCRRVGFQSESRRYHPHVTLARSARGVNVNAQQMLTEHLKDFWPGPSFQICEFVLFHSQLHPDGSRYIKLATFPFSVDATD